jgi:hypothetical protein
MIDKITIPVAMDSGRCSPACPYIHTDACGDTSWCAIDVEADSSSDYASPGPECVPGDYAIIPVDDLAALRADSERLGEILTARMNHPATIPFKESCCVGCVRYGVVYKLNDALEACNFKLRTALAGKEKDPDGR